MQRTIRLLFVVSAVFPLSACLSPVTVAEVKANDYRLTKTVQFSPAGSMEVALDDSKLTSEQMHALKQLRSLAIWPGPVAEAVGLAETLSEGSTLQITSPSGVSSSIKRLDSKRAYQATGGRVGNLLEQVREDVGVEAVLYLASNGSMLGSSASLWSEKTGAQDFDVMIYGSAGHKTIASLPARIKTDFGGKIPDPLEMRKAVGAELGKIIIALTDNLERGRIVSKPASSAAPLQLHNPAVSTEKIVNQRAARQGTNRALSAKEVQIRLNELGFNVGRADGVLGPRSVAGLRKFQQSSGIPVTGKLGSETLKKLFER